MDVETLVSANTTKGRSTAFNAFERFLVAEGLNIEDVERQIRDDTSGDALCAIMSKYAMNLINYTSAKAAN